SARFRRRHGPRIAEAPPGRRAIPSRLATTRPTPPRRQSGRPLAPTDIAPAAERGGPIAAREPPSASVRGPRAIVTVPNGPRTSTAAPGRRKGRHLAVAGLPHRGGPRHRPAAPGGVPATAFPPG